MLGSARHWADLDGCQQGHAHEDEAVRLGHQEAHLGQHQAWDEQVEVHLHPRGL